MEYSYCGKSGLMLPKLSLGLWHNFGSIDSFDNARAMILHSFEKGITHFDLANNYGPEPGSAEVNFGRVMCRDLKTHRDEMIVSSKAGHRMWPGPYGDGSSRKSLMASINQSLRRTGLDYFDIFYSHRYDGVTPIEETMEALVDIVRQGKALYVGISKYPLAEQQKCYDYLKKSGVGCLVSQYRHSMFDRVSSPNLDMAMKNGSGVVCFSPLAQGLLTDKYLKGIPPNSRAAKPEGFLRIDQVTSERIEAAGKLRELALKRSQTLPQMALAWLLNKKSVTSVIIGSSSTGQIDDNIMSLYNQSFSDDELKEIETILAPLPDCL